MCVPLPLLDIYMQLIPLILQILTVLPKLIGLVSNILKEIKKANDSADRAQAVAELKDAVKVAKKTGNTSEIEKLYIKHRNLNGG